MFEAQLEVAPVVEPRQGIAERQLEEQVDQQLQPRAVLALAGFEQQPHLVGGGLGHDELQRRTQLEIRTEDEPFGEQVVDRPRLVAALQLSEQCAELLT